MKRKDNLDNFRHLKVLDYFVTGIDRTEEEKCAVYDERVISDEEVRNSILNGEEFRYEIIYMTMRQYRNVFRGGK